jgi:hypothetical protein
MIYVLIVINQLGGFASGSIVTFQEFSSQANCITAQKLLADNIMHVDGKALCVLK